MNFVFQISAFNDTEKIELLVKYLSKKLIDDKIIILIHINIISDTGVHKAVSELSQKYDNIHILDPIVVKWSHISHVYQKICGIQYLNNNNIEYDYYICITENDIPIKDLNTTLHFIKENKHKSYFFDYFCEIKSINQYYELLKNLKFKQRIFKTILILFNEINFSEYSLTHKWRWYFYSRNIKENTKWPYHKKLFIKIIRFLCVCLYLIPIIIFYFNPTEKNYINAQKWQFGRLIKNQKIKLYSEWQYSITSFFSYKYTKFILANYSTYIDQFKNIYAPDESFWISMAKNFPNESGECIFNWKPMILGLVNLMSSKNGKDMKLTWDYKDFKSLYKYNDTHELFARKANSLNHMKDLLIFLKIYNELFIE